MSDPVFLITGASSGIGAATARHAADAGYRLVLAARSVDRLTDLAGELGGEERALALECDVTEWEQQQAVVERALDRFGRLDVAFANAGFGAVRSFLGDSGWAGTESARDGPDQRLRRGADDPGDASRAQAGARASAADRVGGGTARAARLALLRHQVGGRAGEAARQELNDTGVRVTVIEPGKVDTPFFDDPVSDALEPDDVARTVMFAVSQPAHVDINEILVRPTAQAG